MQTTLLEAKQIKYIHILVTTHTSISSWYAGCFISVVLLEGLHLQTVGLNKRVSHRMAKQLKE